MSDSVKQTGSFPLVERLRTRARSASLFLLLDYDGTLVPIRRRPGDAVADDELVNLLHKLTAHPRLEAAVVSGRSLADLATVLPIVPGLWRFGNHGGEGQSPDGVRFPTADFGEAEIVLRDLQERLGGETWPEGAWLEGKSLSLVLHYWEAGEREAQEACATVRAVVDAIEGGNRLGLLEGKMILEAVPAGLHKGLAVEWLRDNLGGGKTVFVALGDDVTDEQIFKALGDRDIAIRVGEDSRPSAASWRLEGPEEVRTLLDQLLRETPLREGDTQIRKERA